MRLAGPALVLVALMVAIGCGRSETGTESHQVATMDLAPTIAQLGAEEQADVDAAVEKLAALGDPAVPALEAAIRKEAKPIQLGALEALGQMGTPRADGVLVAVATKHDDPEVRATALLRLGAGGRPAARPVLEAALADPSSMVSQTAAMACGASCTSPAAIDRIVDMGLQGVRDVEVGRIRSTLAGLLGGADQAAAAHTREAIRSRTAPILAGEGSLELRTRAALLASDAGVPDVEPVLLAAAAESKSPVLRTTAINWLGRSGSAAGVPVLESALGDPMARMGAAMALQTMAGRGIAEAKSAIERFAAQHAAATARP